MKKKTSKKRKCITKTSCFLLLITATLSAAEERIPLWALFLTLTCLSFKPSTFISFLKRRKKGKSGKKRSKETTSPSLTSCKKSGKKPYLKLTYYNDCRSIQFCDVDKHIVLREWSRNIKFGPHQSHFCTYTCSSRRGFKIRKILSKLPEIDKLYSDEAKRMMTLLNEYNFPIFQFAAECKNKPLFILLRHISINSGLTSSIGIDEAKFLNFIWAVENSYRKKVSFHNSTHAADVLHCIYCLLRSPVVSGTFSSLEILSMYIAAAVHDIDHPGIDNDFLVATCHSYSCIYNDMSVLENHHCFSAFSLMNIPECNFVSSLTLSEYVRMRQIIVEMIMATDPSTRLQKLICYELQSKLLDKNTPFNPKDDLDDKIILARSLIRVADISNTSKNWHIYREWTRLLSCEQKHQMHLENIVGHRHPTRNAEMKLKLSSQSSLQKCFLETTVYPITSTLCEYLELKEITTGVDKNLCILSSIENGDE